MSPRWLFFPTPASSAEDWDTYEDGIYETVCSGSGTQSVTELQSGSETAPSGTRWFGSKFRLNGYTLANAQGFALIWFPAQTSPTGHTISATWELWEKDPSQSDASRTDYLFVSTNGGGGSQPHNRSFDCIIVMQTQEISDINSLNPYNGPT